MADANYAVTSGYATANAVDNGTSATDNIFTDGRMGWDAAITWADQLSYEGYNDWRLFSVDETCSGHNCSSIGNELGHLFYVDLGVTQYNPITSSTAEEYDWFTNVQSSDYWSGAVYAPNTDLAWVFLTHFGYQDYGYKANEDYTWAVRSGDVAETSIPEPTSLLLLLSGLLGLSVMRKRLR